MKTSEIISDSSNTYYFTFREFEEAFYSSMCRYSISHIKFYQEISQENIKEALHKSLKVCFLAGMNVKQHFKKIYVYDDDFKTLHVDWRLSKTGFNLITMQISFLNEKMAHWLWELADR